MSKIKENIAVITSVERKRRWSCSQKKAIVLETYQVGVSVSQIARKYGIFPSQLFYWRKLMEEGGVKGISSRDEVFSKKQYKELEQRLKETERLLGKKTLENEILREAVIMGQEKNLYRGNLCSESKIFNQRNSEDFSSG